MQNVGGVSGYRARSRHPSAWSVALALALMGCGPDSGQGDDCHRKPTFLVTLLTDTGAFPADTRLSFEYGSGPEYFELDQSHSPQVVFCKTHPPSSGGDAGAPAVETEAVTKIVCELWTGGTTVLEVTATGFLPVEQHALKSKRGVCTVEETIELRSVPAEEG